jgi:beta-phosphoglucomutase family hydrolase
MLGLPRGVTACLFDLDGVLTNTASLHDQAWKRTFDAFLKARGGATATPFDARADYRTFVDGKRREDGVRDFLASRGIQLPEGQPSDSPSAQTVHGLGNRKNALLVESIRKNGVDVFAGSRRYLQAASNAGLRRAVVSSSANAGQILTVTGLAELVEFCVDGVTAREQSLRGKPSPDTFLAAARLLSVSPERAAVFEDALAGVEAGRAGRFGYVVGVDRVGQSDALRAHGADVAVRDLAELLDTAP